jgi:hypothetical protein
VGIDLGMDTDMDMNMDMDFDMDDRKPPESSLCPSESGRGGGSWRADPLLHREGGPITEHSGGSGVYSYQSKTIRSNHASQLPER